LMLQANPTLTPNAVKAILQYTAQAYPGYDTLTQGAGFLNARGAIDLVRFFAAPSGTPYPSDSTWSSHLIWGDQRVQGGLLGLAVNSWSLDIVWGRSPVSQSVAWGAICASSDCSGGGGTWTSWGA